MKPHYLGIDLGTTNSTAAVFDGDAVTLVRNREGSPLTPSVVRLDARGNVTVGTRARRFLDSDPANTRAEFKRLMGTDEAISFAAAKVTRKPQELAAEVLKSLRVDIQEQLGFAPTRAVITVPALFEIPQSAATSQAAELAGFEKVELLQEPVASALAAGWTRDKDTGHWLVYDLGGGTFDASLLETRDGMLRVVGHDGDNFLGGRDVDNAIVDWALAEVSRINGVHVDRSDPVMAGAMRKLKLAAEEAKMELGRGAEAALALPGLLETAKGALDVDLLLTRETLERLASPLVERSIEVCRRLLVAHKVAPGALQRIVLVGGPTVMPFLRRLVKDGVGAPLAEGLDPMTLVAQGAALYAASAGLDCQPQQEVATKGRRLWLKYPAMSADLMPYVVGKVMEEGEGPAPAHITLRRSDGTFQSKPGEVGPDGAFVIQVELIPRKTSVFTVEAVAADARPVAVTPATVTMAQGLSITDPPLSRSIGVALANDQVKIYFDKGTPLPARKTVTHHTVESVARGHQDSLLKIPIVQGEYAQAHLCRMVGSLEIGGAALKESLPMGSAVEVTLEVDRGGKLSATALVPSVQQLFEGVARLLVPNADVETLAATLEASRKRIVQLRSNALREGATHGLSKLGEVDRALQDVMRDVTAARGGDVDAAQKARRILLELDAQLDGIEAEKRWPELDAEVRRKLAWVSASVSDYGTAQEKKLLQETVEAMERARLGRQMLELERQLRVAMDLGHASWYRNPDSWVHAFEDAEEEVQNATDLPKAQLLARDGRKALERGDTATLKEIVRQLWRLLPPDVEERRRGFDSGVR